MFVNVDDVRQGSNRVALARIDAVVSTRLGPARVGAMLSRQRSIGRLPCTWHIEWAGGARPGSAGSTTAGITR
jgi:hypothetical protein